MHGPIPEGFVIARIDNDPCNSRIQNLRLVRRSCLIPEETIPLGQLVVRLGYCSVRGTKVVDRDNRIVEFVEFAKAGREYRVTAEEIIAYHLGKVEYVGPVVHE